MGEQRQPIANFEDPSAIRAPWWVIPFHRFIKEDGEGEWFCTFGWYGQPMVPDERASCKRLSGRIEGPQESCKENRFFACYGGNSPITA